MPSFYRIDICLVNLTREKLASEAREESLDQFSVEHHTRHTGCQAGNLARQSEHNNADGAEVFASSSSCKHTLLWTTLEIINGWGRGVADGFPEVPNRENWSKKEWYGLYLVLMWSKALIIEILFWCFSSGQQLLPSLTLCWNPPELFEVDY